MGLLRASVDAVIVGSASFRAAGAKALWTPEYVYPSAAIQFRQYRKDVVKKPRYPLLVIVSESGSVHLANAMFHQSGMHVLIVTSERGKRRLARKGVERLSHVTVKVTAEAKRWSDPLTILKLMVQDFGARLLLHEGGPTLFGEFLAKGLVDELFLTIAPQIAGSLPAHSRPRLTAFVEFLPETAPWWKLRSAKNGEDHLYLRYSSRERRVLR